MHSIARSPCRTGPSRSPRRLAAHLRRRPAGRAGKALRRWRGLRQPSIGIASTGPGNPVPSLIAQAQGTFVSGHAQVARVEPRPQPPSGAAASCSIQPPKLFEKPKPVHHSMRPRPLLRPSRHEPVGPPGLQSDQRSLRWWGIRGKRLSDRRGGGSSRPKACSQNPHDRRFRLPVWCAPLSFRPFWFLGA